MGHFNEDTVIHYLPKARTGILSVYKVGVFMDSSGSSTVIENEGEAVRHKDNISEYCYYCDEVRQLVKESYPTVIQWVCSVCGNVIDSDYDCEYDHYDYIEEDVDGD